MSDRIIAPSDDNGHACPAWVRITSARCRQIVALEDVDPAKLAEMEARDATAAALKEARAEARRAAVETARAARRTMTLAQKAEERRVREERSAKAKAERAAQHQPVSREERSRRIKAGRAKARAEGRIPERKQGPAKPRKKRVWIPRVNPDKIPPEGFALLVRLSEETGREVSTILQAGKSGAFELRRQGRYVFAPLDEVKAWSEMAQRRARKPITPRPWAKLCPNNRGGRKRGAA